MNSRYGSNNSFYSPNQANNGQLVNANAINIQDSRNQGNSFYGIPPSQVQISDNSFHQPLVTNTNNNGNGFVIDEIDFNSVVNRKPSHKEDSAEHEAAAVNKKLEGVYDEKLKDSIGTYKEKKGFLMGMSRKPAWSKYRVMINTITVIACLGLCITNVIMIYNAFKDAKTATKTYFIITFLVLAASHLALIPDFFVNFQRGKKIDKFLSQEKKDQETLRAKNKLKLPSYQFNPDFYDKKDMKFLNKQRDYLIQDEINSKSKLSEKIDTLKAKDKGFQKRMKWIKMMVEMERNSHQSSILYIGDYISGIAYWSLLAYYFSQVDKFEENTRRNFIYFVAIPTSVFPVINMVLDCVNGCKYHSFNFGYGQHSFAHLLLVYCRIMIGVNILGVASNTYHVIFASVAFPAYLICFLAFATLHEALDKSKIFFSLFFLFQKNSIY